MKFIKIDLLTLLISLFILGSCKNDNSIGLDVDPSHQVSGTLVDTSTVITNTVLEDTVATNALAKTPLAYFKDPVFGTTEANMVTGLSLPNGTPYTIPTGTVTVDSTVLVLRYADGFYGDSLSSSFKVNVYQLLEKPSSTVAYYNNKVWKVNSVQALGSRTFNARPKSIVRITDIVPGKADTIKKVPAQLRIKLTNDFANDNLFNALSTVIASNTAFQNQVKGLHISLDKSATSGAGGNLMFNLDSSRIDIYYKNVGSNSIDTAVVSLPTAVHAAEIKHSYSTEVQTELANTNLNRNSVYLKGLAGTRARVKFPYLKNLDPNGNSIVLNRAELVITAKNGTGIPYVPLPRLTMYRYDIANQRQLLPDATPASQTSAGDPRFMSPDVFGAYFYAPRSEYHFVITGYVQDLMRGRTVDYGTFIAPVDTVFKTFISAAPTAQTAARTVAIGGDKTSPYRMKLNIIYTKINK